MAHTVKRRPRAERKDDRREPAAEEVRCLRRVNSTHSTPFMTPRGSTYGRTRPFAAASRNGTSVRARPRGVGQVYAVEYDGESTDVSSRELT